MSLLDARADLIGLIYEAAVDRHTWPLVADRLADLTKGVICQIGTYEAASGTALNIAPRVSPEASRSYAEYWVHRNPLVEVGLRRPVGEVLSIHDLMPRHKLALTAFYNEFLAPLGLQQKLGASLLNDSSGWAAFGVWRPDGHGAFNHSDAKLLVGLVPHLQRALQLNLRLAEVEMTRAASSELLERLRLAVALVDAACRVLFANRAGEAILTEQCGLQLRASGVLHAERYAETTALHKLVVEAANRIADNDKGAGGRLLISRGDRRPPLTVLVIPLRADIDWVVPRRPAAMLFITDPEQSATPTAASLRWCFGLTRMEAAVAQQVLKGDGVKGAALRLRVSPSTIRTHLDAVFQKTGTRRQVELVRTLLQITGTVRDG